MLWFLCHYILDKQSQAETYSVMIECLQSLSWISLRGYYIVLDHEFRFFSLSVFYRSWSCRIVLINSMCRIATEPFTADENLREMPLRSLIRAFTRNVLNPKWTDYVNEMSHSSPTDVPQSVRHQHQKWKLVLHNFSVK